VSVNSAVEEALYLSQLAAKVTVVHRRESFRAERLLQDRLFSRGNIEVVWNVEVLEILGAGDPPSVSGVRLRDTGSGSVTELEADGIFIAIGHAPAGQLFQGQLDLTVSGYIKVAPGSTATSIEGVFAAGDVADDVFRQAVTAAGLGCMAALEADRFLSNQPTVSRSRAA